MIAIVVLGQDMFYAVRVFLLSQMLPMVVNTVIKPTQATSSYNVVSYDDCFNLHYSPYSGSG